MKNNPAEIIKEYRVRVEGLDFPIKARIVKTLSGDDSHLFLGELSHYCQQEKSAGDVYQPSLVRQDFNQVEHLIIRYLENFTSFNVIENRNY